MYLNVKNKIAFIHIPRNGGLGLTRALNRKHGPGESIDIGRHCNLPSLKHKVGELDDYFKFCIVRNPYSKLQSVWLWCNQYKKTAKLYNWKRIEDMLEFIEHHPKGKVHWFPQTFFTHTDGVTQNFNKIYRNEKYDEMLRELDLFVPKGSNGTGNKEPLNYFSKKWIEKLYQKDFELLNY